MPLLAFLLALAAIALFVIAAFRPHQILVPLGLALLTAALIVQYIHPVADVVWH